ncbi:adenosine receptor A1-like [Gigantopelta aegis]|uniref:adenosine receptor A1-like n=1 Tax=Gigantopelta aegis TaxID=1735272 RepID=UPI001B88DAFB|nr:adenosine receptor A1-like [Gigantopelta aegis]
MTCVICIPKEKFAGNVSKQNASDFGLQQHLTTEEIVVIMTMGSVTMTANFIVLIASKFTGGGQSPTLVFVRNLCVSDVLVGAYGIFKMIMYLFLEDLLIDFFLPESLFFTASLAYGLSLLCLNLDCFIRLSRPLHYVQHLDKKNMITVMVILWNLSFIVGFLPQVGWKNVEFSHRFFRYYSWHYLLFVMVLHILILLFNCITLIFVKRHITIIRSCRHFISPTSSNFRHYCHLVVTSLIDVCFLVLCYVPLFVYFAFYCNVCLHAGDSSGDVNIVYFIPVFLVKSFVSAIVHGYRTAQINEVMKGLRRRVSQMVQKSRHRDHSGKMTSIQSIAYGDSADCIVCDRPSHRCKHSKTKRSTDTQIEIILDSQMTLTEVHNNHNHDSLEMTKL